MSVKTDTVMSDVTSSSRGGGGAGGATATDKQATPTAQDYNSSGKFQFIEKFFRFCFVPHQRCQIECTASIVCFVDLRVT